MKKAFTLIELLIVVAIIAILAAIAVPNFLEAQVRSKVSRARADMRSMATGVESYYVDNNQYPSSSRGGPASAYRAADPTAAGNVNQYAKNPAVAALTNTWTFTAQQANATGTQAKLSNLTTPISYITSYFPDPFKDTRGATYYYYADTNGWILWSCGPDTDESTGGELGPGATAAVNNCETVYLSNQPQPSNTLIGGDPTKKAFTYDPTNGTVSPGDVWRIRT